MHCIPNTLHLERVMGLQLWPLSSHESHTRAAAAASAFILIIRAGAGGDEAGIWVGDLLRMYQRYATTQGWKTQLLSTTVADAGGYKEAIMQVSKPDYQSTLQSAWCIAAALRVIAACMKYLISHAVKPAHGHTAYVSRN